MDKKILKFTAIIIAIAAVIGAFYKITGIMDHLDAVHYLMLCTVQACALFVAYNLLFLRPEDFR